MSYKLKVQEPLPEAVKQIAHGQIQSAIDVLSQASEGNRDRAVHQARKHFKKLRSLVRLVRHDLEKKTYQRENRCFREVSHALATVRDAQVRLRTLEALLKHYRNAIDASAFDDIYQRLLEDYTALQDTTSESTIETNVLPALRRADRRVDNWTVGDRWGSLKSGLRQQYAQGRKGLKQVQKNPSSENLHDWRKRVKDLWYHLRLLSPLWPDLLKPWSKQAMALAELLGDDHDLAVLRDYLMEDPTQFKDEANQLGILLSLIRRRQHERQTEAIALGQRLYAESPKAFTKRMKQYWRAHHAEQAQADSLPEPAYELPAIPK
ncbi:MAG: CHAD domain-containing protein [Cyanobacteria bacterium P01_A01_bin.135]